MYPSLVILSLLAAAATFPLPAATVRNRTCTGGVEAARIRMDVRPQDKNDPRSLSRIKRIVKGSRILYKPIELPPDIKKDASVTLVLRSAEGNSDSLTVLDFKPAAMPVEWVMPFRPSLVILALGPQGLDEKRVNNLVKDDELLASLADYADQTNEIEAMIEMLNDEAELEQAADDATMAEEELSTEVRLSRGSSTDQALGALLRAVNSSFITGNPFGMGRRMGPVTMANKATAGFFDNAGALFPGGGALSEIRPFLFPDTEFRAAFVQHTGENLSLCVPRTQARSRNRQVYLWARNIIDTPAPVLKLASNGRLAIGTRAVVALRSGKSSDWNVLDQADRWTLQATAPSANRDPIPVRVRTAPQARAVEIDLRGFPGSPGKYQLHADWDWDTATVAGDLELAPLADLRQAKISPDTVLIEGGGPSAVHVVGTNFEFIERVTLRRAGTAVDYAETVPFALPKGRRAGLQETLDVEVDASRLRSGSYLLALAQTDGKSRELQVEVEPPEPEVRLENLPLRLASNPGPQRLTLRGVGLERIRQIEATGLEVKLDPPVTGANERGLTVEVRNGAAPRTRLELALQVEGSSRKRNVAEAFEVVGPRPRVTNVQRSIPQDLGTALRPEEMPVGSFASFALTTDAPIAGVRLECDKTVRLVRAGERDRDASLSATGANTWFLSVDPVVFGNGGCDAKARIQSVDGIESDAVDLGKPIRLPKLDSIAFSGEQAGEGAYAAVLTGQDLELIERTGWAGGSGSPVTALPAPVAGQAHKQTLRVSMPWPSPAPKSPVHIWLRGESEPRTTTVSY